MKKKVLFPWLRCSLLGALCMAATVYFVLEINYLKITVPVTDILNRYFSALIFWLLFERYIRILQILHNSPETVYKFTILSWFKSTVLYGVLYWGVGVATFCLLGIKFVFCFLFSDIQVSLPVTIFYAYTLFFILWFCFWNCIYIGSYIGVKYRSKKE
jgi:hypothetical protein